jgi:hypothetical protein
MDKSEFVHKAPEYYAVGIAITLAEDPSARTIQVIDSRFGPGQYYYFQKEVLVDEAFKILAQYGVIHLIPDDFGPTLFAQKRTLRNG